jgi:hypothetical protein
VSGTEFIKKIDKMLDFADKNRAVQSAYKSQSNMGQFYILTNPSGKIGQSNEVIEIMTHAEGAFNPNLVHDYSRTKILA